MSSKDDLLKLLDLDATAAPEEKAAVVRPSKQKKKPKPQPYAVQLDEWGKAKGKDLLADQENKLPEGLTEEEVADFHGSLFEMDPELLESCSDPKRLEYLKTLFESPEYQALHAATMLSQIPAMIGTKALAEEYAKQKGKPESGDPIKDEIQRIGSVGRAVQKAAKEVEELTDAMAACGLGGDGAKATTMDPKAVADLYRRIRANPKLRRIVELAGRFRRLARSKQRTKASHGYDDLVGVKMDDDIGRLLPSELAKLAVPEFEDDVLRRLVEKQTMVREYRGSEPVGKGPIVVCVDESGSMSGEKVATAKALALAMAWIARHQKRWCALVSYAGGTEGVLLVLPPGKWNEGALCDWLEHFYSGGTDLDVPLRELPGPYWKAMNPPKGKTDILCITDAIVHCPPSMRDAFLAWKRQEQVRFVSFIVGAGSAGDLAAVSDEVHLLDQITVEQEAVQKVVSI